MRYLASLLLAGLLFPVSFPAQLASLEKASFRVEAGGSYTSFENTFATYGRLRESGRPSFTFGAYDGLPLVGELWGEVGLRYARIAHKLVTTYSGSGYPAGKSISYLSSEHLLVPIGLRYQVLGGPVYVAATQGRTLGWQIIRITAWTSKILRCRTGRGAKRGTS